MSNDPNLPTETKAPTSIAELDHAEAQTELDDLAAHEAALQAQLAEIAKRKADAKAKQMQPRDVYSLGLKARDAILNYLQHRNDTPASQPEADAWRAMAAFFESLGN